MKNELDIYIGIPLDDESVFGVDSLGQEVDASGLSSEIDPTSLIAAGIKESVQPTIETNPDSWRQHAENRGEKDSARNQDLRNRVRMHMEKIGYKPNRIF